MKFPCWKSFNLTESIICRMKSFTVTPWGGGTSFHIIPHKEQFISFAHHKFKIFQVRFNVRLMYSIRWGWGKLITSTTKHMDGKRRDKWAYNGASLSLSTRTIKPQNLLLLFLFSPSAIKGLHMKLNELFICHNTQFLMNMMRQHSRVLSRPSSSVFPLSFRRWRRFNALERNLCIVHRVPHNILPRGCVIALHIIFGFGGRHRKKEKKIGLRLLMRV